MQVHLLESHATEVSSTCLAAVRQRACAIDQRLRTVLYWQRFVKARLSTAQEALILKCTKAVGTWDGQREEHQILLNLVPCIGEPIGLADGLRTPITQNLEALHWISRVIFVASGSDSVGAG